MVTLLIIADDLTGALDTGVQFSGAGAVTRVVTDRDYDFSRTRPEVRVLVMDAETRHLTAAEAGDTVRKIARRAVAAGISHLFKKTDSGLRGNVGGELQGIMEGMGARSLHFIPALPAMGRITRDGVHYVDGAPVAEGVFGADPFEPVRHSAVADILAEQTALPVWLHPQGSGPDGRAGIHVYDAGSQGEVEALALALKQEDSLSLLAGCSGLAAALPELLGLSGPPPKPHPLEPKLLVACGSVNPITRAQLDRAEESGAARRRLTSTQKLDPDWLYSGECGDRLAEWRDALAERACLILDVNDVRPGETGLYAEKRGLDTEQVRVRIAATLGALLKRLMEEKIGATLLLTGGDTLLAFLRQIGVEELIPGWELAPGVVISRLTYENSAYDVISKSGGFGDEDLICRLIQSVGGRSKEEKVC